MRNTGAETEMDYEKGKSFDEHAPRYMCCCGCIHAKTGTLIIAILAVIGLIFHVPYSLSMGYNATNLASSIISLFISGVAVACVFYALYVKRASFLIPYMVLQILGILVFVGLIVLCIFALTGAAFPQSIFRQSLGQHANGIDMKTLAAVLIVAFVIDILLLLWFFWVVYKCFIFFRDRANYAINNTTGVAANSINVNPITYKS